MAILTPYFSLFYVTALQQFLCHCIVCITTLKLCFVQRRTVTKVKEQAGIQLVFLYIICCPSHFCLAQEFYRQLLVGTKIAIKTSFTNGVMMQNELLFLLWRLVLILWRLKAIPMLIVMKLRKLPLCSTPYGNIIISKTQVFLQGFTTLVCIMYNAKDTCFSRKS